MLFSPTPRNRNRLQLRISERRLLLMVGDTLCIIAAVLFSLLIWAWVGDRHFDVGFLLSQVHWFFLLVILWLLLASANDFYELSVAASRMSTLQHLIAINLQMLVVYLIVFFVSDRDALPRLFILYYGVISFTLIVIWRLVNPALVGWASEPRRILIVGTDWAAHTIAEVIQQEGGQVYLLLGIIAEQDAEVGREIRGIPVLGSGSDLLNFIMRDGISELVLTSTRELSGEIFQQVMDAYERGVAITPMPILYERITGRVPVEHVNNNWAVVLPISGTSVFDLYEFLSRLMDVLFSFFGLLVYLVLLPFLAVAIYLDSPGPIFFTQNRMGLNGRIFRIIKFRTMIPDAEKYTGAVFAQKDDPRVTRVGRILRKTRLDELPQLINVLRGDMSLVGPRPERPEHIQRLQQSIPFYRTRHVVRPGVTGWAQVRYHYGATDEDALVKLQYDLYYIRHRSLMLDLTIVIRTIGKVLKMAGQ